MCVCRGGSALTIFYNPKAPMKGLESSFFLLTHFGKTEQRESLFKRRIIFENRLNQLWVLSVEQYEYNNFSVTSRDVVVS